MSSKLLTALKEKSITSHQYNVYSALMTVPRGMVTTYKEIGLEINCKSAQAIGQALKKNPYAPDVPCHRVVRTDLTLGGFSGSTGDESVLRKMKLLQSEGVDFQKKEGNEDWSQVKVLEEHVWRFREK